MKRIKEFGRRRPTALLLACCYGLCLLIWLLLGLGLFVYNRALYASGVLAPAVLSMDDFTKEGIEPLEGGWVTTTSDPKLILNDPAQRVDTLRTSFTGLYPLQVEAAFYAKHGQPYSLRRMVYAQQQGAGQLYWLPAGGGQNLRLDPDSAVGNILHSGEMVINEKRPFYAFFWPSATGVVVLLAAPALLAGGLAILRQGAEEWCAYKKKKGGACIC